jgi:prevent-host-death family protein
MIWRMQVARQMFSALVRRTLDEGPQVVTRRGAAVVVVISAREYARLTHPAPDFADFLCQAPDLSALDLDRAPDRARVVEL